MSDDDDSPSDLAVGRVTAVEFARRAGCDEKQVRRALIAGKLERGSDGLLDAAQLTSAWRRTRRDSKPAPKDASVDPRRQIGAGAEKPAPAVSQPPAAPPALGGAQALKEAVTRKEEFAGRLRELEYLKQAGRLIDIDAARKVLFDAARSARDAWLNFVPRHAALIAADLGVDADKVAEVLGGYVYRQITKLGNPEGVFAQG